jgi:hypothetical protein
MKLLIALLFSVSALAAIPEKQITEGIGKKLDAIASAEKWKDFLNKSQELFPKTSKSNDKTSVVVKKEELDIDGSFFTLGVGYRQTFIHAPLAKVKKILNSPELFKDLYGLDASSDVDDLNGKGKPEERIYFRARIFKTVPLIPNQDYVLDYTNSNEKGFWIQRAKLHKDNEHFALRDNLKVLESSDGGTIFREISMLYALKWYVRFFGPSVRKVMDEELAKITDSVRCLAERDGDPTNAAAADCWKKSSKN